MPLAPFVSVPKRNPDGSIARGPDGKPVIGIAVNPVKQFVKGFWLTSDPVSVTLAPGGSADLEFLVDSQGHFDWAYILGSSTAAYTLEFFDAGTQRLLQNRPVHSVTVVGSGVRPFRLPEPYFLNVGDSQRVIKVTVRNNLPGAQTNTIELVLYGRRFYHKEAPPDVAREIAEKFGGGWRTYAYFLVPQDTHGDGLVDPVPAGGFASQTFNMDANADTDLQKLMVVSTGAFQFRLRERATNRTLSNGTVLGTNGWGNAEFPFYFADTYLLERDKQLLFEITDLSGADNFIFATIGGRRLQYR